MEKKLTVISTKVDQLVNRIEDLGNQYTGLSTENHSLKSEISRLKRQVKETSLGFSDKNEQIKRKLTSVLERLNELESLAD